MLPLRYFPRLLAALAFGLPIAVLYTVIELPLRVREAFRAWRRCRREGRPAWRDARFQLAAGVTAWTDTARCLSREHLVRLWDYRIASHQRPWPWYIATLTDYGCAAGYPNTYRFSRLQLGATWWTGARGQCRGGISIPFVSPRGAWRLLLQWRERRAFRAQLRAIDAKYAAALQAAAPEMLKTLQDLHRWLSRLPADLRDGSEMPDRVQGVIFRATGDPRARLATDSSYAADYAYAEG